MGERAKYKINVLKKAIEKYNKSHLRTKSSSSGYQPSEVNQGITEFWKSYWEDLSVHFPSVSMPKPGVKGPTSTFIGLGKSVLPSNVIIYHKFVHGFVDLQFDSLGENVGAFINHFQSHLEDEMTIQKVGKSGVAIRIEVPKINPQKFYEELQDDVYIAHKSAKKLLEWFQMKFNVWTSFNSQL